MNTGIRRAVYVSVILFGVWPSTAFARCPAPTATQIVLYDNANFGGSCWVLNQGLYPTPQFFGNDAVSSLIVGSGVNAQMFHDAPFGGDVAFYPPGSYATVGRNANDSFSAAKVISNVSTDGQPIFPMTHYVGNTNENDDSLGENLQGLAHDNAGNFYVTNTTMLSRYPPAVGLPGFIYVPDIQRSLSDYPALTNMNCNHFGDPDALVVGGATYILIPVEGCTFQNNAVLGYDSSMHTALAVMDTSLEFVTYDALFQNRDNAAFVAVKGTSLYSAANHVDGQNPIVKYAIDTTVLFREPNPLNPHYILYWDTPLYLTHEDGTPVSMFNMQGGVFSSDGRAFYTNNGATTTGVGSLLSSCDASMEGNDWGGIRVFDANTGVRIASSSLTYGNFQYEWHCGSPQWQEPEGMDFIDLGPLGSLHVFMYSNNPAENSLYFKHYSY